MDRQAHRHTRENTIEDPGSPGRQPRASPSPSRPTKHTVLSPLQALSPLQPTSQSRHRSQPSSDASSIGTTRSRASSITKSLSRRQSLIAHAARWGAGMDYEEEDVMHAAGLFSRLTLVKAPSENSGLKRWVALSLTQLISSRTKSSSALAPFSAMAAAGDAPATSARGPRRSFAASSFAGMTPMAPVRSDSASYSPGGPDAVHRITQLYSDNDVGIQRRTLSPEEVVEVARSLSSPVMVPEGGFKRSELKRRKSAGSTFRRTPRTPEDPNSPDDQVSIALEPVEYVQLDDDTLLPFVERPAEVAELLSHASNEKMFDSLRAAFPKTAARSNWQSLKPEEWSWDEFCRHLTVLTRVECPDYAWVFRARQAVRQRSVALWEKVGVCLGCDGDLLNAGGEDDIPPSWGGLGLGEEGEYDPSENQVYIAALEATDPSEVERQLREEFGEIVEDEGEAAAARMSVLIGMATIGEGEEEARSSSSKAGRGSMERYGTLGQGHSPHRPSRVGLQILTSPTTQQGLPRSPSAVQTPVREAMPIFERGPGSPLFPSSFSSLSVEPNLGRSASVGLVGGLGMKASAMEYGNAEGDGRRWSAIGRKASGAGLSESEWSSAGFLAYDPVH